MPLPCGCEVRNPPEQSSTCASAVWMWWNSEAEGRLAVGSVRWRLGEGDAWSGRVVGGGRSVGGRGKRSDGGRWIGEGGGYAGVGGAVWL